MTETELQRLIADLCGWLGVAHFHVLNAKGMTRGWPDSVIVGQRILYRELKSEAGRLTPEQRQVGYRIKAAGGDWDVWRPRDWLSGRVERELRLLAGQPELPLPA